MCNDLVFFIMKRKRQQKHGERHSFFQLLFITIKEKNVMYASARRSIQLFIIFIFWGFVFLSVSYLDLFYFLCCLLQTCVVGSWMGALCV